MAVQFKPTAVVPNMPTFNIVQPQQKIDPNAYTAKILKVLPVDTRYVANPTNQHTYSSMADVLLNKEAWRKRWDNSDHAWLDSAIGYLPRVIVDSYLLTKEQTIDPIVQGAIDSGVNGLIRGVTTATLNGLTNLGNTMDILSNPIKGLVLEGSNGFIRGLYGDENGRKQYNYNDYIKTGNGLADAVLSFGAETLSDPINWFTWGSSAIAKAGGKEAGKLAVKSSKDVLVNAIANGTDQVDDLVDILKSASSQIDDVTAKKVLKEIAGENNTTLTQQAVQDYMDSVQDILSAGYQRQALDPKVNMSEALRDSKSTRVKAWLFDNKQHTAVQQVFASKLMADPATQLALPGLLNTAKTMRSVANKTSTALRHTAGITGTDWLLGGRAGLKYTLDATHNARLKREAPEVVKQYNDLVADLRYKEPDSVVVNVVAEPVKAAEAVEVAGPAIDHAKVFDELNAVKTKYAAGLLGKSPKKDTIAKWQTRFRASIQRVLDKYGIEDIDEYAKLFTDNPDAAAQLRTLSTWLKRDYTEPATLHQLRRALGILQDTITRYESATRTQEEAMDIHSAFKRWKSDSAHYNKLREVATRYKELQDAGDYDAAAQYLIKPATVKTLMESVKGYNPAARDSVFADFNKALSAYVANPTDTAMRDALFNAYGNLYQESFDVATRSAITSISNLQERLRMLTDLSSDETYAELSDLVDDVLRYPTANEYYTETLQNVWGTFNEAREAFLNDPEQDATRLIKPYQELTRTLRALNPQSSPATMSNAVRGIASTDTRILNPIIQRIEKLPILPADINNVIDPSVVRDYALKIYSTVNAKTHYFNDLLGIDANGRIVRSSASAFRITEAAEPTEALKKAFPHARKLLQEYKDKLQNVYESNVPASKADALYSIEAWLQDILDDIDETYFKNYDDSELAFMFGKNEYLSDADRALQNRLVQNYIKHRHRAPTESDTVSDLFTYEDLKNLADHYVYRENSLLDEFDNLHITPIPTLIKRLYAQAGAVERAQYPIDHKHWYTRATKLYTKEATAAEELFNQRLQLVQNISTDLETLTQRYGEFVDALQDGDINTEIAQLYNRLRKNINAFQNLEDFAHSDLLKNDYAAATLAYFHTADFEQLSQRLQRNVRVLPTDYFNVSLRNIKEIYAQREELRTIVDYIFRNPDKAVEMFFKVSTKAEQANTGAPLANLLNLYHNNPAFQRMINPETYANDTVRQTAAQQVTAMLNRLDIYRNTVTALGELCDRYNLPDFYRQGLLDQLVTVCSNSKNSTAYIGTVVNRMLDGTVLQISSRTDADILTMDHLLTTIAQECIAAKKDVPIAQRILDRMNRAHDSEVDVDNTVDLLQLSQHTNNPHVKNTLQVLKSKANGRKMLAIDSEAIDSAGRSNAPFQISVAVLDKDGRDTNRRLNIFIKPAKGVAPLDNLKAKLGGNNPDAWWKSIQDGTIVDAHPGSIYVNSVDEAFDKLREFCGNPSEYILVGQNIDKYDLPLFRQNLTHFANKDFLNSFMRNPNNTFDTYSFYSSNNVFDLPFEIRNVFGEDLRRLLQQQLYDTGYTFGPIYGWQDIQALSDFKAALQPHPKAKKPRRGLIGDAEELDEINESFAMTEGHTLQYDPFNLDDIITSVRNTWVSPARQRSKSYFVVTDLNPDTLDKSQRAVLDYLVSSGLVDVEPGINISKYFNADVKQGSIFISPKMEGSYEYSDFFKDPKTYVMDDGTPRMDIDTLRKLTLASRSIRNDIHSVASPKVQKILLNDAKDLLSYLRKTHPDDTLISVLKQTNDPRVIVAEAVYFYNRYSDELQDKMFAKRFKDLGSVFADTNPSTPLLNSFDEATQTYRYVYERDVADYKQLAEMTHMDNPLYDIREYNTNRHVYNMNDAARQQLRNDEMGLAEDAMAYVKAADDEDAMTKAFKRTNNSLDYAAKQDILNTPDRVQHFKDTAYARGGMVYFETDETIDLSDFRADSDFIVRSNLEVVDKTTGKKYYRQFIGLKRAAFEKADPSVKLGTQVAYADLDEKGQTLIRRLRQHFARYGDVGYSHGEIMDQYQTRQFHGALLDNGILTADELAELPGEDFLKQLGYFDDVHYNNSYYLDYGAHTRLFGDGVHVITDPFKQMYYNTRGALTTRNTELVSWLNFFFNDYTDINSSWFKLANKDLVQLSKANREAGGWFVLRTSKKSATGLELQEIHMLNSKSVDLAKQLGAHWVPRELAVQLMQATNKYTLPPIARWAKSISDVYKIAYLGSIGVVLRNLIDSNYKTRWGLDGQVSIPEQVKELTSTIKLLNDYNEIGKLYSGALHDYFHTDLDYTVLHYICNHLNDTEAQITTALTQQFGDRYAKKIASSVTQLLDTNIMPRETLEEIQKYLIDPQLFSITNTFVRYGPSAGLTQTVLDNITNSSLPTSDANILNKFNNWVVNESPLRYIYEMNSMVEQSARLSMYLLDLQRGSSISEATRNVIRTHFDYSDKSLGMVYTEILFPFMSFSYKNLDYWINTINKNPLLVGELENTFRSIMDYHSIFVPNEKAYNTYDYTFDWSKDIKSFEANAPWQTINAGRLYHLLAGNILIKHNRPVDINGKDKDLYTVFKLSPSVLDAVNMLYNPLDAYSQRMLAPVEPLSNAFLAVLSGEAPIDAIKNTTLLNMLPYTDVVTQRLGVGKDNNVLQRIKDIGVLGAVPSVFSAAYVPTKKYPIWYNAQFSVIGGLKTNYYAKRMYSDPYKSSVPRYTLTRMAQSHRPRSIYAPTKRKTLYQARYNSVLRNATMNYRLKDMYHY